MRPEGDLKSTRARPEVYILDTDTLTRLHAGHPRVSEQSRHIDDSQVATTVVTKVEVLRRRFAFLLKAANTALRERDRLS